MNELDFINKVMKSFIEDGHECGVDMLRKRHNYLKKEFKNGKYEAQDSQRRLREQTKVA